VYLLFPTGSHWRPAGCRRLIDLALEKRAEELMMTWEELRTVPAGKSRRTKHDDMTVVVMFLESSLHHKTEAGDDEYSSQEEASSAEAEEDQHLWRARAS
jgi:hypothetical protein